MSFAPIDKIHQALHAFHIPSTDRTRSVPSVHYCSCSADGNMFQCLVYNSDAADAKLIGIEYMVDESIFVTLPEDEKKYWHSHKHEVSTGTLVCIGLKGAAGTVAAGIKAAGEATGLSRTTGGGVPDAAEQKVMERIYRLYGKIVHTWPDPDAPLPLGPPLLMMSTTDTYPGPSCQREMLRKRDEHYGIDTESKRKHRHTFLDLDYSIAQGADQYDATGEAPEFVTRVERMKTESK
ncbi:uncharacterized protein PFL1_03526 [Pseudozyma flocculosa PF-1]|uniref:Uncharacterized protein n=2 Tax=Pseudozyma flocculosa TaxID=84751 RepID=A0A5C3F682_9BASI|nr:uncharacterized protein PFL1_03526 [Pseudozyma flocculosa PF-1]EPQ28722.1 hypothetical protein PFL1_03526 [Pseudozyma flocculosa PF-1]SPO39506.1 uncharacterized protein PSFLO_04987 [Pseudozyma flocculosa]